MDLKKKLNLLQPRYLLVDYPPEYSNLKKHLLATTEVPPTWQLDSMVLQLARGMQALADARLVHRDLGARNLLVSFPVDDKVRRYSQRRRSLKRKGLTIPGPKR